MSYEEVASSAVHLGYQDKLRLAQLLIQLARKEEEETHPSRRETGVTEKLLDPELVEYVASRLRKLKPRKKDTVFKSIGAMLQFQSGVSDQDKEMLFKELLRKELITMSATGKASYPSC